MQKDLSAASLTEFVLLATQQSGQIETQPGGVHERLVQGRLDRSNHKSKLYEVFLV